MACTRAPHLKLSHTYFFLIDTITRRLEKLTGPENALHFNEGVADTYPTFQEVVETMANPVELQLDDLHRLLARIEGVELTGNELPPGRPQLIVTDFKLDRVRVRPKTEVLKLTMKILKREFL